MPGAMASATADNAPPTSWRILARSRKPHGMPPLPGKNPSQESEARITWIRRTENTLRETSGCAGGRTASVEGVLEHAAPGAERVEEQALLLLTPGGTVREEILEGARHRQGRAQVGQVAARVDPRQLREW